MVFDVLILVPAAIILLASFQNNQRRKAGRFLKFFIAFAIVVCIFAFNLFGLPTLVMNYASYASSVVNLIPATYRAAAYANLYIFIIILLISLVLYLLFWLFSFLFSRERKRMKNPLYAPKHNWFVGLLIGILRAALTTYILILLVKFTVPLTSFDISSSIVIGIVDQFDPLYAKLLDVFAGLNVPWIV